MVLNVSLEVANCVIFEKTPILKRSSNLLQYPVHIFERVCQPQECTFSKYQVRNWLTDAEDCKC